MIIIVISINKNSLCLLLKIYNIYDAWGNHAVLNANGQEIGDAAHIGNKNPFRYRSYYFDTETELYYLKSRYYDPELGRFITIDDISYLDPETINGLNLYAYCGNNPVMNVDPNGNSFLLSLLIGALVAGLISGTFSAIKSVKSGGDFLDILGSFVGGFIIGGVIGAASILGGGLAVGAFAVTAGSIIGTVAFLTVGTFAGGVFANWAEGSIKGDKFSLSDALAQGALTMFAGITNFLVGFAMGAAGMWNSLKPGNGFMDALRISKDSFIMEAGRAGVKSILLGVSAYLGTNLFFMFARAIIKYIFTKPWKDGMAAV